MRASEFTQLDEANRLQKAIAGTIAAAGLVTMPGDVPQSRKEPVSIVQKALAPLHPEDLLMRVAKRAKITGNELAHLMSQASHETLQFTRFEENLKYKTADRLVKVFPSIFKNEQQAKPYVNNPEKLANRVYANRFGNGDEASGDGWKYRGRGLLMVTFKANYEKLQKATGLPLVDNPELAADPKHAAQIAVAYWMLKVRHRIGDAASLRDVTRIINPGMQDVERREKEYKKYADQIDPNNADRADEDADDEQGGEGEESHKHNLIPFPKGSVRIGVSDVYDWYKIGTHINDLDDADPKDFGQGPPQTMLSFGSEEEEHRYMRDLKRLGLGLTDLDE